MWLCESSSRLVSTACGTLSASAALAVRTHDFFGQHARRQLLAVKSVDVLRVGRRRLLSLVAVR
jgi:hypothetical protein